METIAKAIKASRAIIDGEIVAIDNNGVQCFEKLQNHGQDCFIIFFAFDLLFVDGESLTESPLVTESLPEKDPAKKSVTKNSLY